jgi:hypothetical protein
LRSGGCKLKNLLTWLGEPGTLNVPALNQWRLGSSNLELRGGKLKGWSRNLYADIKREKADILRELDSLDCMAETHGLGVQEKVRRKELLKEIEQI